MIKDEFNKLLDCSKSVDLLKRDVELKHETVTLYYLTSLIDSIQFNEIIKTLLETNSKESFLNALTIPSVSELDDLNQAIFFLYSGAVIMFYQESVLCLDIRSYQTRSTQEPEAEKSIRGSKDGFVETLNTNIGLLRRRIKTELFHVEHFTLSSESKMSLAVCYLEDKVNNRVLKCIKNKIDNININSLVMTDRALEELLFAQQKTIFPLVRYTERPDVAAISIIKGKIVVLVDTSSSSLIIPTNLFDHFCNVEEYREPPLSGTLTRFIRSVSIIVSIILLPLFICLTVDRDFTNNIINLKALTLSRPELIFQVLASVFIMEVFRIASIHTPSSLVSGVSFVAAIILGEIGMKLGVFLPEILLVVSISMICSFATPSYELSLCNRIIMLILTILSISFGYNGLLIGIIILFMHLLSINVLSYPYLYPICPFDYEAFKDIFRRKGAKSKKNL